MKKEAINTFGEGLIMDLHPLTTPSNVLTNCLNGTIITYNGNEFVLQNDMGNGRVESAYLPSGYVPIGVKESGGIIYIASYNPLTNKGQIGSFPSPERNISSNEISDSTQNLLEDSFLKTPFQSIVKTKIFNSQDQVIRPGDKFNIILTGNDKNEYYKLISHYNNTEMVNGSKQVKSFKNKLLNLDLGVIDNYGSIKIITKDLKRLNPSTGEVITYTPETSDLVKYNDGFWASSVKIDSGQDIDEYRKHKGINTYNNKLVGDLYLISSLNTIDSLDFSIYGEKKENNQAKLTLDITYRYNCPDGKYTDSLIQDKQILGYEEDNKYSNVIGNGQFKLSSGQKQYTTEVQYNPNSLESYSYSPETQLYTARFQTTIEDSSLVVTGDSDIREYEYIPTMKYDINKILLNGLKVNGTINLSNLGTGLVSLNTWRYFCTNDNITLTWGFEMYLKPKEEVQSLVFKFHELETGNIVEYTPSKRYNYNGTFTDILNNISGLTYGKTYYVEIVMSTNKQPELKFYRWLLFTTLYNDIYYSGIQDYGVDNEKMQELRQVYLKGNLQYTINSSSSEIIDESGKPAIDTTQEDVRGNIKKRQTIKYNLTSGYDFIDAEKYPFKCNDKYTIDIQQQSEVKESDAMYQGSDPSEGKPYGNVTSSTDTIKDSVTIDYATSSYYILKKDGPGQITYSNILTKYEDRLKSSINYDSASVISTGICLHLFVIAHQNTGAQDRHGYAFYFANGQSIWTASNFADDAFTVRTDRNGNVDYQLSQEGYSKMISAINANSNTPVFIQVCTDLNFIPQQAIGSGYWEYPNPNALQKKRMLLWYDGSKYCFVTSSSLNSPSASSTNIMANVINRFKDYYVRQNGNVILSNKYFPTLQGSSYNTGGSVKYQTKLTMTITPQSDALNESYTLASLKTFLGKIITQDVEQEAQKMVFNINKSTDSSVVIDKEVQLYDVSSYINSVTSYDNNIEEPVIYDGTNIYYNDAQGNIINTNYIYDSNRQVVQNLTSMLIASEYHVVPRSKGSYGNYDNYGKWGQGEAVSTLSFNNLPIINY